MAFVLFSFFKVVTNCKNTVQGFKRFHGRAFLDPYVQSEKSSLVYDLAQMPSGMTGIKVNDQKWRCGWTGSWFEIYIFTSLLNFLLGDVHGGGESLQHWTSHCHAADQTEGDCWDRNEETCGWLCHLCKEFYIYLDEAQRCKDTEQYFLVNKMSFLNYALL